MVMRRWEVERQRELFVATDRVAKAPRHVFYGRLNSLLREAGLDRWVEGLEEEKVEEKRWQEPENIRDEWRADLDQRFQTDAPPTGDRGGSAHRKGG